MMGYGFAKMPPKAPLPMAQQDFSRCPKEQASQERSTLGEYISRTAAFAPAILLTLIFSYAIFNWLSYGGVTPVKAAVVMLVAFTFIWVSLSAAAVALGISRFIRKPGFLKREKDDTHSNHAQRVALLTPIYNEDPADVFGNAWAMLQDLSHGRQQDSFTLFILSDTKDPAIARLEEQAFFALQETVAPKINVFYRRRADNTDKKVGNIADWIENWGAAYDAMLILDADSLMSGAAIRNLARELAAHPEAGLIQSFPALIGSRTLFGRMQQFSNAVYGWLLAEGLSVWSQSEGNYWGHNAIIRVRAFADSARLPHLPRRRGSEDLILSHDFVEAGMLRRAGWGVRFLPRASGSFEETPQTVIDYCLRDRRWCKGNLQHLRLLTVKGFHPVSRFHLLQGAFAFLMSPAWFALLIVWSLVGTMSDNSASYFTPLNPLYPVWPEQAPFGGSLFLFFIYGMLLLPKVLGAFALGLRRRIR
ncbi:MAG: glucans biosynthesis glucosyltransferase MdoH, partial [Pseudomonadota bacterium]